MRKGNSVVVSSSETTLENDDGIEVSGLNIECSRCRLSVSVFGTGPASLARGCVMLREQCPRGERNYYSE